MSESAGNWKTPFRMRLHVPSTVSCHKKSKFNKGQYMLCRLPHTLKLHGPYLIRLS